MVRTGPGAAKKLSAAMLPLGVVLLWFIPLGGGLLLATGSLGLALAWEPEPTGDPEPSSDPAA